MNSPTRVPIPELKLAEPAAHLAGRGPLHVLWLIVDGLRADVFEAAFLGGRLPRLAAAYGRNYLHYRHCVATFPTVTVSSHASLLTGAYPARHGIVGNEWFVRKAWAGRPPEHRWPLHRATREYVKVSLRLSGADPGLANGFMSNEFFNLANADLYPVPTVFEAYPGAGASIHGIISRGASEEHKFHLGDLTALSGRLGAFWRRVWGRLRGSAHAPRADHGFDRRGFEKLWGALRNDTPPQPRLTVLWLPSMDGFSHGHGASAQPRFFDPTPERRAADFDKDMGRTLDRLRALGTFERTLVVLTADHGHYDTLPEARVTPASLYRHLAGQPALAAEVLPLTASGRIDEEAREAGVVISANGGACFVNIRGGEGWGEPPSLDRLRPFLQALERHPAVDLVFFRDGGAYRLWRDGAPGDAGDLPEDLHPLAARRLQGLAPCRRAGDIVLVARPPHAFGDDRYLGQHGRLAREDSLVPLWFFHPALPGLSLDRMVETVDLAPAVAAFGSRPDRYFRSFRWVEERRRKLDQLLDTLEAHLRSSTYRLGAVPALLRLLGRYPAREFRRGWSGIEAELRENISAKIRAYREKDLLDRDTLERFEARLARMLRDYSRRAEGR